MGLLQIVYKKRLPLFLLLLQMRLSINLIYGLNVQHSSAAGTGVHLEIFQLPIITITAEKQDERHSSSQAITQFNHN